MSFAPVTVPIDLRVPGAVLDFATPPRPYPNPDLEPGWSARVVDMFGTVLAELPDVNVRSVGLELNRPNTCEIEIPKLSAPLDLRPPNEIQVWRNDQILFWGPVTRVSASSGGGAVTVQCQDPQWYFERRYFGRAQRNNLLGNGGFESGLSGWTPVRLDATHQSDSGLAVRGNGSARLHNRIDPNAYLAQTVPFESRWPYGMGIEVAAWVRITEWHAETEIEVTDDRGTRTIRPGLVTVWRSGGAAERIEVAEITADTPRNRWVRLSMWHVVDPGAVGTLEVRLYGVDGTVTWDEVQAALPASTSGDPGGNDQAELVRRVISYAQNGQDKSHLNVGTSTPATGVIIPLKAWQHADHEPIMGAIREFVEADDGLDVHVEITPHTRTFTTHYPFRGVDRSPDLTLSSLTNVASFGYDVDVERTANSVVVLGPSSGPTREEGGAADLDALPGGLVLEHVVARPDLTVAQLDPYAAQLLAQMRDPVQVIEAVIHDRSLIGVLDVGDLVSVDLDDGIVQVDGTWRIVRAEIDARTDTISATLNRWAL